MSCGPPCPPCAPPAPPPCPQVCKPPPQPIVCRHKPTMRSLHWAQTTRNMMIAGVAGVIAATGYLVLIKMPRYNAYKEFYEKAELEDWADEMAKKGLYQAVPPGGFKEKD